MYVDDISAYHFVVNPFQKNTHICKSGANDYYICDTRIDDERWGEQVILRPANNDEIKYHNTVIDRIQTDNTDEY